MDRPCENLYSPSFQQENDPLSPNNVSTTDVLCGRGKHVINHPGNIILRSHVKQLLAQHNEYNDKTKRILQCQVYENSLSSGQFLVKKDGSCVTLSKPDALKKIAQQF